MKGILKVVFFVAACLMLAAPAAIADTIGIGDYVKVANYNPKDNAGVMTFAVSEDKGATTAFYIDTFCIQDNVYIYLGRWYPIAGLSTHVGLFDSPAGAGPLNGAVDYLFYRYKSGYYDAYMKSPNTTADLNNEADLQKVLWGLQGSGSPYSSTGHLWDTDLITYDNTPSMHHSWGTGVINIASAMDGGNFYGPDIQNQLYSEVPEPATFLLFGAGLACELLRRKLRGKSI
ncbi:MAG: PEP-CTERM sorting domain-containing protein [Nitrospiraceae bacterium]|nr:PEP-CTERM sorting domain-containing protein [Nitrospiraceae bacterium]